MGNNTFRVTNDLLATQGQRLGNYFIDLAVRYVIIFAMALALAAIAQLMDLTALTNWLSSISTLEDYLIAFVIMFIYYNIMEITLSRSVGKYITKTIVVMSDGSKPNDGTIIKRTLCRYIPLNHFSFVGGGRGWHDTISDTYVVKKEDFDEKIRLFYSFEEIGKEIEI